MALSHDQDGRHPQLWKNKNLQKFSFPEPVSRLQRNLLFSIGVLDHLNLIKVWPQVEKFYTKVKFGPLGICMAKVKIIYFSKTVAAYYLKVGICIELNYLMSLYEYQRPVII